MNKVTFGLLIILFIFSCKKDPALINFSDISFMEITDLPPILIESSGLEIAENGQFWSFNDSDGTPDLYQFDTAGTVTRTLNISNATNVDWEDMTQDRDGNIYIGDFGNNDNDRQNLVIYKIANADISSSSNSVVATKIEFTYPEQTDFPPPTYERFFDVESIFSKGEFLYLLTRDRSIPFIGKTSLYRLPNTPGNYEATYLMEYFTVDNKSKGQITAADISPNGKTLGMISNDAIWLFQNIGKDDFLSAEVFRLEFPIDKDMAGLVFQDNCTLYLSSEDRPDKPAILYQIGICD